MNQKSIDVLAAYLTGPDVALNSMGLSLPEPRKSQAERFFDLRDSFGVTGYMDVDVAKEYIKRAVDKGDD